MRKLWIKECRFFNAHYCWLYAEKQMTYFKFSSRMPLSMCPPIYETW